MGIVTANLVRELVGKLAKTGTAPGNNADPTTTWAAVVGAAATIVGAPTTWADAHGWQTAAPYGMGSSDYVGQFSWDGGATTYAGTKSTTYELWVKYANDTFGGTVFAETPNGGQSQMLHLTTDGSGYIQVGLWDDTLAGGSVVYAADLSGSTYHHVVITLDASYMTLYVDNVSRGTPLAMPAGTITFNQLDIHGERYGSTSWTKQNGPLTIAAFRIYNAALTTGQIGQNYAAGVDAASSDSTLTVATTAITAITATTAASGGSITDPGGSAITARGVCWNTTGTPTIADSHTSD